MKNTGLILIIGAFFLLFMAGFIAFMNPASPSVGLPTAVIGVVALVMGIVYLVRKKEKSSDETDRLLLRDLEEESLTPLINDEDMIV